VLCLPHRVMPCRARAPGRESIIAAVIARRENELRERDAHEDEEMPNILLGVSHRASVNFRREKNNRSEFLRDLRRRKRYFFRIQQTMSNIDDGIVR